MKQLVSAAMLAAIVASCSARITAAQQGPAPSARPTVAVIDMSHVFKNYTKFNDLMANMKRDVDAAEGSLRTKQEQFKVRTEAIQKMPLGSQERNKAEEELTQMQANIQVEVATQQKEFLRHEAQIYYRTYHEIQDVVRAYCERHGIFLVMRFNGDAPDPNNPKEILQDVNKVIVYNHRGIDITEQVLGELQARLGTRPPVNRAAAPSTGAQGVPRRQ